MRKYISFALFLLVILPIVAQETFTAQNGQRITVINNISLPYFRREVAPSILAEMLFERTEGVVFECSVRLWNEVNTIYISLTDKTDFIKSCIYGKAGFVTSPLDRLIQDIYTFLLLHDDRPINEISISHSLYIAITIETERGNVQFQAEGNGRFARLYSPMFISAGSYSAKIPFNENLIGFPLDIPYYGGKHKASYLVYYVFGDDEEISAYPVLDGLPLD